MLLFNGWFSYSHFNIKSRFKKTWLSDSQNWINHNLIFITHYHWTKHGPFSLVILIYYNIRNDHGTIVQSKVSNTVKLLTSTYLFFPHRIPCLPYSSNYHDQSCYYHFLLSYFFSFIIYVGMLNNMLFNLLVTELYKQGIILHSFL